MARCPLLHELGKNSRVIAVYPLVGHMAENNIPHGPALPVWNNNVPLNLPYLIAHPEEYLIPFVYDIQVLQAVTAQLGVGGRRLGCRTPLSHD